MKRFLAIVLTLCMLISMSAIFVSADAIHEDDEATLVVASGEDDYGLPPDNIFPFIYSLAPDWKFFREYVGVCNCKEGYLYAKNTDTNVITQLYADPVVAFAEANTNLYFITMDNKILRTDYAGKNLTTIYSGGTNDITHVDYHNNKLFFAEGTAIRELNLSTMAVTELTTVEDIFILNAVDSNTLVIRTEASEKLVYEKQTDTVTTLYGETGLVDYLESRKENKIATTLHAYEVSEADRAIKPVDQNDIQFPLAAYPAGSYFSMRSGGCNHAAYGNAHCRAYGGAKECMGFAMYASDQFAHLPWTNSFRRPDNDSEQYVYYVPDLDENGNQKYDDNGNPLYIKEYERFNNVSEVRIFFRDLTKGAYVRLSAHSGSQNTLDEGTHSIVYVEIIYTGVQTYDSNRQDKCDVKYDIRSFNDILIYYPYRYERVSHHYSSVATQLNMSYHKYSCANCAAYITAPHKYVINGTGLSVCSECGYLEPLSRSKGSNLVDIQHINEAIFTN